MPRPAVLFLHEHLVARHPHCQPPRRRPGRPRHGAGLMSAAQLVLTAQAKAADRRRELDAEAARTIQAGRTARPEWS